MNMHFTHYTLSQEYSDLFLASDSKCPQDVYTIYVYTLYKDIKYIYQMMPGDSRCCQGMPENTDDTRGCQVMPAVYKGDINFDRGFLSNSNLSTNKLII